MPDMIRPTEAERRAQVERDAPFAPTGSPARTEPFSTSAQPRTTSDGPSAVEQLAQFEDRMFGRRAPRVQGKVERGHGSLLRGLSAEDQALHAALEEQADAEAALAGANAQAAAAQAGLDAARERCARACEVSEAAVRNADAAQVEPGPETPEQRRARLAGRGGVGPDPRLPAREQREQREGVPPASWPENETVVQREHRLAAEAGLAGVGTQAERDTRLSNERGVGGETEAERVARAQREGRPFTPGNPNNPEPQAQRDSRLAAEEAERQRIARLGR